MEDQNNFQLNEEKKSSKISTGVAIAYSVAGVLVVAIIVGGLLAWKSLNIADGVVEDLIVETISDEVGLDDLSIGISNYNNGYISFEYPSELNLSEENGVQLSHDVPYEHFDVCDMSGNEPMQYSSVSDFYLSMMFFNSGLQEVVELNDGYVAQNHMTNGLLNVTPGFIDEVNLGSYTGYKMSQGVEGCGVVHYYVPVSSNKTLLISKRVVHELNTFVLNYSDLLQNPEVILPAEEQSILNSIFSSLIVY